MSVLEEVLKQVPALAVLAYIVIQFLRHLEKKNTDFKEINKETIAALRENSAAMAEVRVVLKQLNGKGA